MGHEADGSLVAAINLAVPPYEEDPAEEFIGPGYPGYTEYLDDEFYEDDDEEPELVAPGLEQSDAQRFGSYGPSQTDILRDYIHSGSTS